jgi:hypothetical protein
MMSNDSSLRKAAGKTGPDEVAFFDALRDAQQGLHGVAGVRRIEHETFDGSITQAQNRLNAWLAKNSSVRVISVESLINQQSSSMVGVERRTELGLRVWFEVALA